MNTQEKNYIISQFPSIIFYDKPPSKDLLDNLQTNLNIIRTSHKRYLRPEEAVEIDEPTNLAQAVLKEIQNKNNNINLSTITAYFPNLELPKTKLEVTKINKRNIQQYGKWLPTEDDLFLGKDYSTTEKTKVYQLIASDSDLNENLAARARSPRKKAMVVLNRFRQDYELIKSQEKKGRKTINFSDLKAALTYEYLIDFEHKLSKHISLQS